MIRGPEGYVVTTKDSGRCPTAGAVCHREWLCDVVRIGDRELALVTPSKSAK